MLLPQRGSEVGAEVCAGRGAPLQHCLQSPHSCSPRVRQASVGGTCVNTPSSWPAEVGAPCQVLSSDPRLLLLHDGGWGMEAPSPAMGEQSCSHARHLASGGSSPSTTLSVSRANRSQSPGTVGILGIPAKLRGAEWTSGKNKQLVRSRTQMQKLTTSALKCVGKTCTFERPRPVDRNSSISVSLHTRVCVYRTHVHTCMNNPDAHQCSEHGIISVKHSTDIYCSCGWNSRGDSTSLPLTDGTREHECAELGAAEPARTSRIHGHGRPQDGAWRINKEHTGTSESYLRK